jgi:ATP-dependent DNA helicase RecQ
MAALRPTTPEEMGRVSGVGAHKLGRYGSDFLREIKVYCDERAETHH